MGISHEKFRQIPTCLGITPVCIGAYGDLYSSVAREPESAEAIVADLIFIVPRTELKWYGYLKQIYADESRDVVLDRRTGERRRSLRPPPVMERRHSERRHRDITWELQSAGWALVRRR